MKILIVAGEASGDLHGSYLARALIGIDNGIEIAGVGGSRMREAGVSLYFDIKEMGVVGATEVIGKLPFLMRVHKFLRARIDERIFDAVILIDYPTLNLRLAERARKRGIPVFYYISPQLWAWRRGRIRKIAKNVNKMIVILPFEKDFYRERGVDVEFVGHPFVDIVKPTMSADTAFERIGLDHNKKTIGIFPGSRKNELKLLLPVMLSSASLIKQNYRNVQFVISLAETVDRGWVDEITANSLIDVEVVRGYNYDIMNISDLLIMASGSATLEASFFAIPMVIVYKVNFITYLIGRMLINVPSIGLVNIVAKERIVPELIQYEVTPERIASYILGILNNPQQYLYISKRLKEVSSSLGDGGAPERTARIIVDYLNEKDRK